MQNTELVWCVGMKHSNEELTELHQSTGEYQCNSRFGKATSVTCASCMHIMIQTLPCRQPVFLLSRTSTLYIYIYIYIYISYII